MADRTWRLNSLARTGHVELELSESADDGPLTYMLTLALPFVQLRFQITSPSAMQALSRFANDRYGRREFAEFQLGVLDGLPVLLIKDDEHPDRFFIRAMGKGMIDVTIVDPIASDFICAATDLAVEAAAN
jgi:hypothetical protein